MSIDSLGYHFHHSYSYACSSLVSNLHLDKTFDYDDGRLCKAKYKISL